MNKMFYDERTLWISVSTKFLEIHSKVVKFSGESENL